jgi:5-methylthioribose kinase
MFLLDPTTTEQYLRNRGELDPQETVRVTELSGGVSNQVLLVERSRGDRFVLKQAREQLRVQQEWKCDVTRIWREMDVLRLCGELLDEARIGRETGITACVPDILFEDREQFAYAMTAAPPEHTTWKRRLLLGDVNIDLGITTGRMLAALHAGTWKNAAICSLFEDSSYFHALRLDPYYQHTANQHPKLRDGLLALIESVGQNRCCLVHGDFSPKNLLIWDRRLMLIDFEVGYYGDPAFDNGFFLCHLVLKAMHAEPGFLSYLNLAAAHWSYYCELLHTVVPADEFADLERRSVQNLAGCLLARVDGKSPVDYLNASQQKRVRELAEILFAEPITLMYNALTELLRVVRLP